jgi:hypothetical protein
VRDIGASAEVRALPGAGKPGELHRDTVMRHQRWHGWIWMETRCDSASAESRHRQVLNGR